MIRYGVAKDILAKYAGSGGLCRDDPLVDLFVRKVLQYLLFQGTYGNERKFCFVAHRGVITIPYELEVPLKASIDGEVASVWNRWFEYHSGNHVNDICLEGKDILEEPNRYPTVYDLPECGSKVGVIATCLEGPDAHVIIKGKDPTGRQIFTWHKGEQIVGEYLHLEKGRCVTSTVTFGSIDEIYKTVTKGYVQVVSSQRDGLIRTFLADLDPFEESPSYRRLRFLTKCNCYDKVSVLGRIRLKNHYADEDIIPFDNLYLLEVAGQSIQRMGNIDVQTAIVQDQYVSKLIEQESVYKKVNNGQPVEMFQPLSGGAVRNARPYRSIRRSWRRR